MSVPSLSSSQSLVVLSRNRNLFSTRRLVEAARLREHQVRVIDPLRCYMRVSSEAPQIHYRGAVLENIDAVIPRIGASVTIYGTAVLRQFRSLKVWTPSSADAILRARNKWRAAQILAEDGIPMPRTAFADNPDDTDDLLDMLGDPPHVLKLVEGTQGTGVVLSRTRSDSASLIGAFRQIKAHFLVQEFIAEAGGADIRAFVIGDRVVAAMRRQAREGEFRANLHRGARASEVELSVEEQQIAVRAARKIGLGIAGVDLLRSHRGPLVLEVNASPGLEGIERATGLDIAGMIVDYCAARGQLPV